MKEPLAALLVVALSAAAARAGEGAAAIVRARTADAECRYLVGECARARAAANRDAMYIEHPTGVVFKTTSPAATHHVLNAIDAAHAMLARHGVLADCVRRCDELLKR